MMKISLIATTLTALLTLCAFSTHDAHAANLAEVAEKEGAFALTGGDPLQGNKGDKFTLTNSTADDDDTDNDKPEEVTVLWSENGEVRSFNYTVLDRKGNPHTSLWVWDADDCRYHPMRPRLWYFLEFEDLGSGIYKFEVRNAWHTGTVEHKGHAKKH